MVAAPKILNSRSLKSVMRVLRTTALVTGLSLMLASAGQALMIDLDRLKDSPVAEIDIDIDGHAGKVKTEVLEVDFQITADGPIKKIRYTQQTIEFVEGPIAITGVHLDGSSKLGLLIGDDAWLKKDELDGSLVLREITHFNIGEILDVTAIDAQPPISSPVPEPGAALLFAAGLTAIGATRRTNR